MTRLDCISGAVFLPRELELCHDVESNPGPRVRASATNGGGVMGLGSRAGTGSSSNSSAAGGATGIAKEKDHASLFDLYGAIAQ